MPRLRAVTALLLIASAGSARAQDEAQTRRDSTSQTIIATDFGYTSFASGLEAWRTGSVSLSRRGSHGSVIGRLNVANRFGATGTQVEADAYPRLGNGRYMYLNAGWSGSSIFPGERLGAELYSNLPHAWEASLGLRVLWFDESPVTLFTGTVGKYTGNYWISVRPFVRTRDTGTSASAGPTVRRYTVDADNYLGGRVSFGSSPSDQVTPDAVARTSSASATVQGSRTIATSYIGTWSAGYDREGLDGGSIRKSWNVSIGVAYRYR